VSGRARRGGRQPSGLTRSDGGLEDLSTAAPATTTSKAAPPPIVDGAAGRDYLVGSADNDTIRISFGGIERYFSDAFDQVIVWTI
jgi:hypothetical protein